ncbi:hypothetical protein BBP40_011918 [Aspergillus hancockii]|nr:hypothetical protein BBP40_011918 [Aspergillus hancockii]
MLFLSACSVSLLFLQGVIQAAGNPIRRLQEDSAAVFLRQRFDRSIGRRAAECGNAAATLGATCPGNACCSKGGLCRMTDSFGGTGCQSNCVMSADQSKDQLSTDPSASTRAPTIAPTGSKTTPSPYSHPTVAPTAQPTAQPTTQPPSGGSNNTSSGKVVAGYWGGWNMARPCGTMKPEEIPAESLTHLIFSFGFVAPNTYEIQPMPDTDPALFTQVTNVKKKNPNLKVLIALGGWSHTDPGPYQAVFTTMVSTPENRQKFIKNLLTFLPQYGFDGVDIDWEYPGATDRGGSPSDKENFTRLLQEMRQAFQGRFLVTFAGPTSPWYLEGYDLKGASEATDWINVMAYDIHGTWETPKQVLGHTNLSDINRFLENFSKAGVSPSKLVLGTAFYGRSYKLAEPGCTKPGCTFSGPGDQGPCSKNTGYLSYKEIKDIINAGAKPTLDQAGAMQYLTWGQNNWVAYDDAQTIKMKVDYANQKGLKGVMSWAIDLDDERMSLTKALSGR